MCLACWNYTRRSWPRQFAAELRARFMQGQSSVLQIPGLWFIAYGVRLAGGKAYSTNENAMGAFAAHRILICQESWQRLRIIPGLKDIPNCG